MIFCDRVCRLSCPDIDVNAKGAVGRTPLHEAANAGNVEATTLLLETDGVDVRKFFLLFLC